MTRIVVSFDRLHRRMMLQTDSATSSWLRSPGPSAVIMNISRLVEGHLVVEDPKPWEHSPPAGVETPTSIAEMLTAEFQRAFPDAEVEFVSAGARARAP